VIKRPFHLRATIRCAQSGPATRIVSDELRGNSAASSSRWTAR